MRRASSSGIRRSRSGMAVHSLTDFDLTAGADFPTEAGRRPHGSPALSGTLGASPRWDGGRAMRRVRGATGGLTAPSTRVDVTDSRCPALCNLGEGVDWLWGLSPAGRIGLAGTRPRMPPLASGDLP